MKRRRLYITGGALALLSLTGCGLSASASPTHSGSYHISGTVTTTTTGNPSNSSSSNGATAPASPSSGYSNAPSPAPSSTPSTNRQSTISTTASVNSPFNPVVQVAMNQIKGSTHLLVQSPKIIPQATYHIAGGYLTAILSMGANHWSVHLRDTTRAEPVNSPAIAQTLSSLPDVGSFGVRQLAGNQVGTSSLDGTTLRQFNPLWRSNQNILNATGKEAVIVGGGHAALQAQAYGFHGNFNSTKLIWNEGNWTMEVTGGSPRYEQDIAFHLVNYLHSHYLPPFPGLIMIDIIHQGVSSNTTAVTHMDWINGPYLIHIDTRIPSFQNPVTAAKMAVSWSHY